jgi:hypothetical protein
MLYHCILWVHRYSANQSVFRAMSQPFNQGPRLSDAPSGDPSAQAIASLRGYAYKLYASGLAWLDLRPDEELYLEVAQDYAVATQNALRGVQVKDTAANATINSEDIRNALDGVVDLVERNTGREVHLHFLSTCAIGREQKLDIPMLIFAGRMIVDKNMFEDPNNLADRHPRTGFSLPRCCRRSSIRTIAFLVLLLTGQQPALVAGRLPNSLATLPTALHRNWQ